jgi:DNA-binding transcriptional LysR family regulator
MTIKQLEYFLALATNRNYTAAAEKCLTTQPNLSRQIAKLESTLGKKLVYRINGKLELTPAGQYLAREGYKVLYEYNDLIKVLSNQDILPEITFGYITEYPELNELMAYAKNHITDYTIKWLHGGVSWLLDTDSVDMLFTFEKDDCQDDYFLKLFDVPIYAVVPIDVFPSAPVLTLQHLENHPLMFSFEQITRRCKEFFAKNQLRVTTTEFAFLVFDVDSYLFTLRQVHRIGFLPRDARDYSKSGFRMIPIEGMHSTISLGIRWSAKKDKDCRIIAKKIQEHYKQT